MTQLKQPHTRVNGDIVVDRSLGEGTFGKVLECEVTTKGGTTRKAIKIFNESMGKHDVAMQKAIKRSGIMMERVLVPFELVKCFYKPPKRQWIHIMPVLKPINVAARWYYNQNLDAAAFALSCPAIFEKHRIVYPDIKPVNILQDPERRYSQSGYILCDCDTAMPMDCQVFSYATYPPWPTGPVPWEKNLPTTGVKEADAKLAAETLAAFEDYMSRPELLRHAMRFSAIATAFLFIGNVDSSVNNTLWESRHDYAQQLYDLFENASMTRALDDFNSLVERTLSFDFPTAADLNPKCGSSLCDGVGRAPD